MSVDPDIEDLRKRLSEGENELAIANTNALAARTAYWEAFRQGIMRKSLAHDHITTRDKVDEITGKLKRLRVLLNEVEMTRR